MPCRIEQHILSLCDSLKLKGANQVEKPQKTVWHKVEAFLWPMSSVFLSYTAYYALVLHPREEWSFLAVVIVILVAGFWWDGFKNRVARFLRDSLRAMIAEQLAESRVSFATWLREDAPWRGENPFVPSKQEG